MKLFICIIKMSLTLVCILGLVYGSMPVRSLQAAPTAVTLSQAEMDWLAAHQPLRVGVDGNFPPYSFLDDTGQITGLVVEHWQLLAGKLKLQYQMSDQYLWQDVISNLERGEVDLVLTMVKTPEREALFDFTTPYIFKSLVIIANKSDNSIQSKGDIAHKKVALVKGYSYVKKILKDFPNLTPYYVDTMLEALEAVESGLADAAITMFIGAKYLQEKYQLTELRFADYFVKHAANESIAVPKGAKMLAGILEKGLAAVTKDEREALNQKWRTDLELPTNYGAIIRVSALALAAITLLSLWLWQLLRHNKQLHLAQTDADRANVQLQQMAQSLEVQVLARTQLLRKSEAKYRGLVESLQDEYIFYQHDKKLNFSYISPSLTQILGYSPEELFNNYRSYLTDNPLNRHLRFHILRCLAGEKIPPFEIEVVANNGQIHHLEVLKRPILDEVGICIGCEGVAHDITERKQHQQRLHWLSHYDELTGLPNRRQFMYLLTQALGRSEQDDRGLALMFVDLKRFKIINDNLGHIAGDAVLMETVQRMADALGPQDTLARFGGDRFYILLPQADRQQVEQLAVEIIERLLVPFDIHDQSFTLDCRIGICLYPDDGTEPDVLLKHVDAAIHNIGQASHKYAFYNEAQNLLDKRRLMQEHGLRRALKQQALDEDFELRAVYQSIIALPSGELRGFEALMRWHHPQLGDLSPAEFIPIAEETGLIFELSQWMLRRVCRQALDWQRQGYDFGFISVNLSAVELMNVDLAQDILALFADEEVQPRWFKLEITETALMTSPQQAIATLEKLVGAGCSIAIDDFGTGYSSLAYLKTLPAETIKIDQSFIKNLLSSPEDQALVKAVISMSQSLGKQVTAEGVETMAQRDFLQRHGCDKAQGYLFSKPLPPDEALKKYAKALKSA